LEAEPEGIADEQAGQHEVHGEACGLYVDGVAGKAAGHHDPAHGALQGPEEEEDDERLDHAGAEAALDKEDDEGYGEGHGNEAAPEAVEPFPEKYGLKIGEGELVVKEAVLGCLLVFVKLGEPLAVVQRREGARDHVPLGDGKSGAGEPCDAAEDDLDHQHAHAHHDPGSDGLCGGGGELVFHRPQS